MSSELNGTGLPSTTDFETLAEVNASLQAQVDLLRRRLTLAEERLGELPTIGQLKAIVDENDTLTRMNKILLRRNEILNRKQHP